MDRRWPDIGLPAPCCHTLTIHNVLTLRSIGAQNAAAGPILERSSIVALEMYNPWVTRVSTNSFLNIKMRALKHDCNPAHGKI